MATPMPQALSMYSTVKTITPELAREWLGAYNRDNRRLRPTVVKALAAAIKRGEWQLTHQGIAFDEHGNLLDGQHRLAAIAAAGASVLASIAYNVPRATFRVIDTHQKRSVGDATGLSKEACAIGGAFSRVAFKNAPRSAVIRATEALAADTGELLSWSNTKKRGITGPLMAGAIARAIETGNKQFCYGGYRAFVTGDFPAMTPLQQAFYRQYHADVKWTKRHKVDPATEAFARSAIAFDPAARAQRVSLKNFETYRELAIECLRKRGGL